MMKRLKAALVGRIHHVCSGLLHKHRPVQGFSEPITCSVPPLAIRVGLDIWGEGAPRPRCPLLPLKKEILCMYFVPPNLSRCAFSPAADVYFYVIVVNTQDIHGKQTWC
jgi:hypothetical protein